MILCVTLNPCLDKTLSVPDWTPGDSVRGRAVSEVVGGKGNNVARALGRLGRPSRPATILGGAIGARCEELLRQVDSFDPLVTPSKAPTRVILTVRNEDSNAQTAFFDPDPEVSAAEAEGLYHRIEGALAEGDVQALTLSGSSPARATDGLYLDLISLARSRKVPVFLDTYGAALESVWGFWPDVIQLNRRELAQHLRCPQPTVQEALARLDAWGRHGVRLALVTDGPRPVLAQFEGRRYRLVPPEIEAVNPIGSGDCLLAGLVDAWLSGLEAEAMLRRGLACAVANAQTWDAGAIDPAEVRRLEDTIEVEPLPGGTSESDRDDRPAVSSGLRVGVWGRSGGRRR
ncbi:1-phosphofructokinase family hexose kinase [soil metagenome]